MRRTSYAIPVGLALMLAAAAAQADPDQGLPAKESEKIVNEMAKADLDALAADASKYMSPQVGATIKDRFGSLRTLGASDYSELIYSREYGKFEKDFIYTIDFAKAYLYVRLLWHAHNGEWQLTHLTYKDDENLPFPAGWDHIYPK